MTFAVAICIVLLLAWVNIWAWERVHVSKNAESRS